MDIYAKCHKNEIMFADAQFNPNSELSPLQHNALDAIIDRIQLKVTY